jgi:hypothetical protein
MNNPGMDFEIFKQLRQKWTDLDAQGHSLKVDFQLVAHPTEQDNILAIDVVQHIDGKPVTETVQRKAGEAYAVLGIAGLSVEQLADVFKGMLKQLHSQAELNDIGVSVTMRPTSPASGEVSGLLVMPGAPEHSPVLVNYQHYYVLNALRDRMIETLGKRWSEVTAVYQAGELEFSFQYP